MLDQEDKELNVINRFIDTGEKKKSYLAEFPDGTRNEAYNFFKRADIVNQIMLKSDELKIYDAVCDKALLNIITRGSASDKDKISAIKVWADIRKRTSTDIKIVNESKIDFSNVTDEGLSKMVKDIMSGSN